jgi:hypothetical protein
VAGEYTHTMCAWLTEEETQKMLNISCVSTCTLKFMEQCKVRWRNSERADGPHPGIPAQCPASCRLDGERQVGDALQVATWRGAMI